MVATTTSMLKILYAVSAFEQLLGSFFRRSIDRAAVVSAGNTGRIECGFTSDLTALQSAIRRISYKNASERTRLWDTLTTEAALHFWQAGRRNVPWVMLTVTDGGDCASTKFDKDPVGAGEFFRRYFTFEPSNFAALVGVGRDKSIDTPALNRFAQAANCPAIAIKDFSLLEEMFLKIAVQLTTGLTGVRHSLGNLSWTELQRVRNLTHVPVDLMLVIDRSGSMYKQA